MKSILSIFFCIFLMSSSLFAATKYDGEGYEVCNCANKEFTNRITKIFLSSHENCVHCSINIETIEEGLIQGNPNISSLLMPQGDVSAACIKASNRRLRKNRVKVNGYRVCGPKRRTYYQKGTYRACGKSVNVRSICISKDYVDMTTNALNEVANCLKVPAKSLFPLFNHESRFILNNKSPTGALCYGQLTKHTVEMLNNFSYLNYKYYSNGNSRALSSESVDKLRLKRILKQCPEIAKKFTKLKTKRVKMKNGRQGVKYSDVNSRCDVVENPYTCMMYSALNHKMNLEYANFYIKRAHVYVSTNQKNGKEVIHKDKQTMEAFSNKLSKSAKWNYLKYEKKSIFTQPEQVAEIAAYFAYNGGTSGTLKVLFADYIRTFQRRLDNSRNKSLRKDFLDGQISTSFFLKEFKQYIATEYKWGNKKERRKEVSTFVDKIIKDLKVVAKDASKGLWGCSNNNSHIYEAAGK